MSRSASAPADISFGSQIRQRQRFLCFRPELCFRVCTHSGKHYGFTRGFARINNHECQEMSSSLIMVHVTIAIADHSQMLFVIITNLLMGQNRNLTRPGGYTTILISSMIPQILVRNYLPYWALLIPLIQW